ncbi:MAG TPA: hypothetical protein VF821_08920 [Lentzea sp.]
MRRTKLRFPMFPSAGPWMIARGGRKDELVLWQCGLPPEKIRLPGPVLAATFVSATSGKSLIALIAVDRQLVVHVLGALDTSLRKLHAPIDFRVGRETRRDLSPLYLHVEEMWEFGVYFRRAERWWHLRYHSGHITLEPSNAVVHQPGSHPFHTQLDGAGDVLLGPRASYSTKTGPLVKTWGIDWDDMVIPVPPGEDVLSLTTICGGPALLTRAGDVIRARTPDDVRTVVEFAGPVALHHQLPWVAVQRSPHVVEVLDVATGTVQYRLDTA